MARRRLDRGARTSHVSRVTSPVENKISRTGNIEEYRAPRRSTSRVAWLLRLVAFVLCVALFVHVLATANLRGAWTRIQGVGPLAILILVPFPLGIACDAWGWERLLGALDRRVSLRRIFDVRLVMEAMTNSMPAGAVWADAFGPILLSQRAGVPIPDGFASLTAKRWLVVRTHGVYVAVAAAVGWNFISASSFRLVHNHALLVLLLVGSVALVLISMAVESIAARGHIAGRLSKLLARAKMPGLQQWIEKRHHQFAHADVQLAKLSEDRRATAIATCRIALLWLFEGLETFLILRLLGAPLSFAEVVSFEAGLSVIRSSAFFAPGGIGVQDVGYLTVLDAYGVPDSGVIGPAFVVLKRLKEVVYILVGGALLALGRSRREIRRSQPISTPQP